MAAGMRSLKAGRRSVATIAVVALVLSWAESAAQAAPPLAELEAVRDDLVEWLQGQWETWPHVDVERRAAAGAEIERDHWYRVIARIDAPQLGEHVLYGELYLGGRDGRLIPGQQIVYVVTIDEARGVVNVHGSGIKNRDRYRGLHMKPALQGEVELHGQSNNCDFRWRRHGAGVHGLLADAGSEEPALGSCSYRSAQSGQRMRWDAEWVLTPDELWVFDNGYRDDVLWMGREDRTHNRAYRMRPVDCRATASGDSREVTVHDRGGSAAFAGDHRLTLLRGPTLDAVGRWLADAQRLTVTRDGEVVAEVLGAGGHPIGLEAAGIAVDCRPRS